jgi:hypothetical protein
MKHTEQLQRRSSLPTLTCGITVTDAKKSEVEPRLKCCGGSSDSGGRKN